MAIKIAGQDLSGEDLPIDFMLINTKYRLFGSVLVLLEKKRNEEIDTARIKFENKRATLEYKPEFIDSLSLDDKVFVMMHEAGHLMLASFSRGVNKDPIIWNAATDIIINELLERNYGLKKPKNCLGYKTLRDIGAEMPKGFGSSHISAPSAEEVYKMIVGVVVSIRYEGGYAIVLLKNGEEVKVKAIDLPFESVECDPNMLGKIKGVIREYEEANYGDKNGDFLRQLKMVAGAYFPFEQVLKRVFEKRKLDFSRRNRRFIEKGTFFPRRKNPRFVVYAAIDVSGSCFYYTDHFLKLLTAMPEFEEAVFFDVSIVKILKKGEPTPTVLNGIGGGTDLKEVMDRWINIEQKNRGKKLNFVCLTDGYVPVLTRLPKEQPLVLTTHKKIPGCKNIVIGAT